MADQTLVGRTNLIILVLGLGGCLVLSMIMQRLLVLSDENQSGVVAKEVNEQYGRKLVSEAEFKISGKKDSQRKALLSFQPQIYSSGPKLARDIGRFVWQGHHDKFDELAVVVRRHPRDLGHRYEIQRPYGSGAKKTAASGAKKSTPRTPPPTNRPKSPR